jgi:endo-1,4-beta-xylanase
MTRRLLLAAALLAAACSPTTPSNRAGRNEVSATRPAGPAADYVAQHPAEIPLWSANVPNQSPNPTPEIVNWRDEVEPTSPAGENLHFPVVTNIHNPSITPYFPAPGKATGIALIVAPGGGHMFLSINHEGYDVAQWFADHGVTCFLLKYRLARAPGSTYKIDPDALADARRAVRLVRARAAEFHIDPDRVGLIGFSAGGELATGIVNNPEDAAANPTDEIDRQSARLNFQCLLYPGNSAGVAAVAGVAVPPTFLAASADDRQDISAGLANAYLRIKALNVPVELHLFNAGGHGFGVRPRAIAENQWPNDLLAFLNDRGVLHQGHSVPVNFPATRPARGGAGGARGAAAPAR